MGNGISIDSSIWYQLSRNDRNVSWCMDEGFATQYIRDIWFSRGQNNGKKKETIVVKINLVVPGRFRNNLHPHSKGYYWLNEEPNVTCHVFNLEVSKNYKCLPEDIAHFNAKLRVCTYKIKIRSGKLNYFLSPTREIVSQRNTYIVDIWQHWP